MYRYFVAINKNEECIGTVMTDGILSTVECHKFLKNNWKININPKKLKTMETKYTKSEIEGMIKNLEEKEKKARSKWSKAILQDAQELLENVIEGHDEPYELSEKLVLNGSSDWKRFSYDGSGLIYDAEIAEHYCTPSELKKVGFNKENMYIKKQPNDREEWLDVQARALRQSWWAIRNEMNETFNN